ncbi:hypothetical protein [Vibrio tapetis]|uniref:hypothetical protein n=1 Tax=Vibrio tapetis TaxID=52443 RepID=UPI001558D2CF|nr:hypothetical protein [Vibrio tapetis]
MRPTSVRFSHTRCSASRRRSSFVAAPVAAKATPQVNLVKQTALTSPTQNKVTQAA